MAMENFNRIRELWGRLICLSKLIYQTGSFESIKVQIVRDIFQRIEEEILLALVKEVETATMIHNEHSSPCSLAIENRDSTGEVSRFEDLNDDMTADYGAAQSDLRKTYDEKDDMTAVNVVVDREVVQETPRLCLAISS